MVNVNRMQLHNFSGSLEEREIPILKAIEIPLTEMYMTIPFKNTHFRKEISQ